MLLALDDKTQIGSKQRDAHDARDRSFKSTSEHNVCNFAMHLAGGGLQIFLVPDCETEFDLQSPIVNFRMSRLLACYEVASCCVARALEWA